MGEGGARKTTRAEVDAFAQAASDLTGLALRSVEQAEVSLPQFRLLRALAGLGGANSTQAAQALGVVGSTVTRLADRLHASGHLVRGVDPGNRSVVMLELTDRGRRVVREVTAHRRRELARVLDQISPAERAACAAVLTALHELLADSVAAGAEPPGRPAI